MQTAAEKILEKKLVASGLSSEEWKVVQTGLRDRALFSSRVGSVKFLQDAQSRLSDLLSNARNADGALTSRAQLVSDLMRSAREQGIATGRGGLTDPGSSPRAAVIVDTNAGLARGYAGWVTGASEGARLAFPAQELIRVSPREKPRAWHERWSEAGARLYSGRMVALKDDPVWYTISAFGAPYPPFDFGSGMGVRDIDFEEAVSLGVIPPEWKPKADNPVESFNAALEDDLAVSGEDDPSWRWLSDVFGKQISLSDGKVRWSD